MEDIVVIIPEPGSPAAARATPPCLHTANVAEAAKNPPTVSYTMGTCLVERLEVSSVSGI